MDQIETGYGNNLLLFEYTEFNILTRFFELHL